MSKKSPSSDGNSKHFPVKNLCHIKFSKATVILIISVLVLISWHSWFSSTERSIQDDNVCQCNWLEKDPSIKNAEKLMSSIDPYYNSTSWDAVEQHHPNFPTFLLKTKDEKRCHLLPEVFKIKWSGVHWQEMKGLDEENYLLYSAFYDNRTRTNPAGGAVRILTLVDSVLRAFFPQHPWCHLWFDGQHEPVVSKVLRSEYVDWQYRDTDRLLMFMLTCAVPTRVDGSIPIGVSLVQTPCSQATNLLKVIGKPNNQLEYDFSNPANYNDLSDPHFQVAVCGPAFYYYQQDISVKLVEWFELMKAVGFSHVFLYTTKGIHPNIQKVSVLYCNSF